MSDFIYCPICDRRVGTDDADYVEFVPDDLREKIKTRYKLCDADMICMECEVEYEF